MSTIKGGVDSAVVLGLGLLKEAISQSESPEALEILHKNLATQALDLWGARSTDAFDNPRAAAIVEGLFGPDGVGQEKAEKYLEVVARLLNTTPARLAKTVQARTSGAAQLVKEAFIAAAGVNVEPPRKVLTAEEVGQLRALPEKLAAMGLKDTAAHATEFARLFAELSGPTASAVYGGHSAPELLQSHGQHMLRYFRRPMRVALLPPDGPVDAKAVARFRTFIGETFRGLDSVGLLPDMSVLGDAAADGLSGAFYDAAKNHPDLDRSGLTHGEGWRIPPAEVDTLTLFGEGRKDPVPLFDDIATAGTMFAVAPGAEDIERIKQHCQVRGGHAIVLTRGGKVPPELEKVTGVHVLNVNGKPRAMAAEAAHWIRIHERDKKELRPSSISQLLAVSDAPTKIRDVRVWAAAESTKYRLLRLGDQVFAALANKHPDASAGDLNRWTLDFINKLVKHTHGIDNFKDNRAWQTAARAAVAESLPEVAALGSELSVSILFASWYGLRLFEAAPSYFDENTAKLAVPEWTKTLTKDTKHTFDIFAYAKVRLDPVTTRFLQAKDSTPEVFLGSREEMQLYYRANGYEFDCTTHEVNGTEFHYFRSTREGQNPIVVIHGVDSEARLEQVAALMKVNGADPGRCIVRGTMARVRETNKSMLEHKVMDVVTNGGKEPVKSIAGVVVGNRNGSIAAVAQMAGVSPADLKVKDHEAGPFKFRSIEVTPVGSTESQLVLAFAPAYGQLTYDLGHSLALMFPDRVPQFLGNGAGGALSSESKLNEVHQVLETIFEDRRISFDAKAGALSSKFYRPIDVPKELALPAVNIFCSTPLAQTEEIWLPWARKTTLAAGRPRQDVDQEEAALHAALYDASLALNGLNPDGTPLIEGVVLPERVIHHQPTLIQTQVIGGAGDLASSTVTALYEAAAARNAEHFYRTMGIGAVATKSGTAEIKDAKAGALKVAEAAPRKFEAGAISSLEVLNGMKGEIADYNPWEIQLRGERNLLVVRAERFGPEEERALREILSRQNPSDCYVIVDATDRFGREIRETAKSEDGPSSPKVRMVRQLCTDFGFTTVVAATQAERAAIDGSFDQLLNYDDTAAKIAGYERLLAHGNAWEDPNYAIPNLLVLGGERPEAHRAGSPPFGLSEASLSTFVRRLDDVYEAMFQEIYGPAGAEARASMNPGFRARYLLFGPEGAKRSEKELRALPPEQKEALRTQRLEETAERLAPLLASEGLKLSAKQIQEVHAYLAERAKHDGYHYTGGMSPDDVTAMAESMGQRARRAFEGGVQIYGDGLTHGTPGLVPAIKARYLQNLENKVIERLPARTGEKPLDEPQFYTVQELERFFKVAGTQDTFRRPLWLQGASRTSWPDLSPQAQHALHLLAEILPHVMEGQKDVWGPVTGGTEWGWEKLLHAAFARHGWHILSTLPQNTILRPEEWELADRVHHFVFIGQDWVGPARETADKIVRPYEGMGIMAGGGTGIAAAQGMVQVTLGTRLRAITGTSASEAGLRKYLRTVQREENGRAKQEGRDPKQLTVEDLTAEQRRFAGGAANILGEKYLSLGIGTLQELAADLGATDRLQAMLKKAGLDDSPIRVEADVDRLERLARSLKIDTKAIRAQYLLPSAVASAGSKT
ncbi:MAG: hypothetical protein IT384_09660 [Deltaproteobacteria bacterium]|nr:hypothetical protein [Deltaproteobacteria bacterium]